MTPRATRTAAASSPARSPRPCALPAALALIAAVCGAQSRASVAPRATVPPDPYTHGEAALLQRAGYVSLGPFVFGSDHTTTQIEDLLGTEPVAWIETAHFRLGCALSPVSTKGDTEWSRRLRPELKRLAEKLPSVRPDTPVLDRWLRAHLTAQRLEDVYADVRENLGATDATFTPAGWDAADADRLLGLGPYLGMREKFTVLLLRSTASHARYTRAYHQGESGEPARHHDRAFGTRYWGASEDTADSFFGSDHALHAHLVFNVAHNLYAGYLGSAHELPPWLVIGLAHWHSRRVSPRFPAYDCTDDEDRDPRNVFWEWEERVPGLLRNGAFEPAAAFLERTTASTYGIEQHMQAWSLVGFLMAKHRTGTMRFLHALKDPLQRRWRPATLDGARMRQLDALQQHLGWTPQQLEAAWRQAVLGRKSR